MSLRAEIEALCQDRLGRLPNLDDPRGYNDKIQWLKLYDQRPEQIQCVDKAGAREWVRERIGPEVLVPLTSGYPAVWKCTHNSGGVRVVFDAAEAKAAHRALTERMAKPYGQGKGEWAYQFVKPAILKERMLSNPTDYKFHCAQGEIRWIQIIWGRNQAKPRECILRPDWTPLGVQMDDKMVRDGDPPMPAEDARRELEDVARRLAQGWQYVRVDLYHSDGGVRFGELTFWPRAGCYRNGDADAVFGDLMPLDLSARREPLC
jgi:hypothetical protein